MTIRHDIIIVGGGASGTLLATQLLLQATTALRLCCVEPTPRLGAGLAYGRCSGNHVLNVPANRISAIAGDPGHFLDWLQSMHIVPEEPGNHYARRQLYADYLLACLHQAQDASQHDHQLVHVTQKAVSIAAAGNDWRLQLDSGEQLAAPRVALALGNLTALTAPAGLEELVQSAHYLHDPWRLPYTRLDAGSRVAIIGSGLTAVDALYSLIKNGHQGSIEVFSRSGHWPEAQRMQRPAWRWQPSATRLRPLLRELRKELAKAAAENIPWHSVIDGLRPHTPALWSALPETDKRSFWRHLASRWNRHRHRLPPFAHELLQQWEQNGQFTMLLARNIEARIDADAIQLRRNHHAAWRSFALVINATGPSCRPAQADSQLLKQMHADALIRPGPCGVGIDNTADGQIIGATGTTTVGLYTIGPLRQGNLLESTAIPEIREQASELAATMLVRSALCDRAKHG
ncbi:MAG: FAD/NAD(P)-binding protein [Gammaproteobacteria bacterium]|nr:FAD/NAD(P)-binding protein [Gammaproteobacteria bacterium]